MLALCFFYNILAFMQTALLSQNSPKTCKNMSIKESFCHVRQTRIPYEYEMINCYLTMQVQDSIV